MIIEKVKSVENLPTIIEEEIRQRKREEFYDIYLYEDNLYMVISLGQKNKAGYTVEVKEIEDENVGQWKVFIQKQEPKKDQIAAQVINYPISITKIWINKRKGIPKRIIFADKNGKAITATHIKEADEV